MEGARREVSVALLGLDADPAGYLGSDEPTQLVDVGDWVPIHVGFAMSRIDDAETLRALQALPVRPAGAGACAGDLLGIDPLYVANEGKLVAVVPADHLRWEPGRRHARR